MTISKRIEKIETHRLTLRPWKESDIVPFIQMNQDPKVMEYFPTLPTSEESEAIAKRFQKHIEENGFGPWAAELKSTGEFVGFLGLVTVPPHFHFTPAIEIGWRLTHRHWGQGLATEGAIEVLSQAFGKLELDEALPPLQFRPLDPNCRCCKGENDSCRSGLSDPGQQPPG